MENEVIWKSVKGYEGIYEVSNSGYVRSLDHYPIGRNGNGIQKGRILKTSVSSKGYLQCSLSLEKKRFHTGVHRLVAIAFIENPNNLPQVNHKDGNKLNNNDWNLEWCTNSENQIHAVENGLIEHNYGQKHHMAKLTNVQASEIREKFILNPTRTLQSVADEYNVSLQTIFKIKQNQTYVK